MELPAGELALGRLDVFAQLDEAEGEPAGPGAELLGGSTVFGIHQHSKPESGDSFSELRPGLDHVGFGVAKRSDLEQWKKRLDDMGIAHGGIVDAPYGCGLSFRDPDNIALELFAPPG